MKNWIDIFSQFWNSIFLEYKLIKLKIKFTNLNNVIFFKIYTCPIPKEIFNIIIRFQLA